MKFSMLSLAAVAAVASISSFANAAPTWSAFEIRQNAGSITPIAATGTSDGTAFTALIDNSGEKAGYGTSFYDGQSVGNLHYFNYNRLDTGASIAYLNIWVSDGTHFAIIAPNTQVTSTGDTIGTDDTRNVDLQTLGFNIFAYLPNPATPTSFDWIKPGAKRVKSALLASDNSVITLADLAAAGLVVDDPNPTLPQGGTNAPKNNTGFNIIVGDSGSNFVQGVPYVLSNVVLPEPTSIAALAGASVLGLRRRRA